MRRRHLPSDPFAGFDPRLALLLGIVTIAVLTAVDVIFGPGRVITTTVVLGPFLTALGGSARTTLGVAVVAVAVAALSGIWNHNFFALDYFVRVVLVSAGGALALVTAEVRERLATDRRRFRLLTGVARVAQEDVSVEEAADRLGDLLVPELADICVIDVERDGEVRRLKVRAHGPRAAEVEAGLRRRAEVGTDA